MQSIIISGIKKSRRGNKTYTYKFSATNIENVIKYVEYRWPLGHGNITYIDGFGPNVKWNFDKEFVLDMFDELRIIAILGKKGLL